MGFVSFWFKAFRHCSTVAVVKLPASPIWESSRFLVGSSLESGGLMPPGSGVMPFVPSRMNERSESKPEMPRE